MTENSKRFDLEDRTLDFAKKSRLLVKALPKNLQNLEDGKQLIRSSGSIGANYIEANESLSKKDFLMRLKICRKEAIETAYWLNLIDNGGKTDIERKQGELLQEARELMNIFASIIRKSI